MKMLLINRQLSRIYSVDDDAYKKWCSDNGKPVHSKESKREFFAYIRSKRLGKE